MISSGIYVMRNVSPPAERAHMTEVINNMSIPLRYSCGAEFSGLHSSQACTKIREELLELYPETMKVEEEMRKWMTVTPRGHNLAELAGLCEKKFCGGDDALTITGSNMLKVNGMKFPYSLLAGPWDRFMGINKELHKLRFDLTLKMHIPFYLGYHRWHIDGDGLQEGKPGRLHKLYLMVDKDQYPQNPEKSRMSSNVMVMPRNWRRKQVKKWNWLRQKLDFMIFGTAYHFLKIAFDLLLHDIDGCVIQMDPGDALFFREDIMHRTQNVDHDRIAMIFNVWKDVSVTGKGTLSLRSVGYGKQKKLWEEYCVKDTHKNSSYCAEGFRCLGVDERQCDTGGAWDAMALKKSNSGAGSADGTSLP